MVADSGVPQAEADHCHPPFGMSMGICTPCCRMDPGLGPREPPLSVTRRQLPGGPVPVARATLAPTPGSPWGHSSNLVTPQGSSKPNPQGSPRTSASFGSGRSREKRMSNELEKLFQALNA